MQKIIMLKAIHMTGLSQTQFAKQIGSNFDQVNSWINRDVKINLEHAFEIQRITHHQVTWQEVSPHLAKFASRWQGQGFFPTFCPQQTIPVSGIHVLDPSLVTTPISPDAWDALSQSIQNHGLHHPIGVDAQHQLIFGHQRLRVYQSLGKKNIRAWVISLPHLLQGNYTSDVFAQQLLESERFACACALEAFIGKRQGQRADLDLFPVIQGRTDETVVQRLGFRSRYTYAQAKKVFLSHHRRIISAVDDGVISIPQAITLLSLPPAEQASQFMVLSQKNHKNWQAHHQTFILPRSPVLPKAVPV